MMAARAPLPPAGSPAGPDRADAAGAGENFGGRTIGIPESVPAGPRDEPQPGPNPHTRAGEGSDG